jgi:hypothetical protein
MKNDKWFRTPKGLEWLIFKGTLVPASIKGWLWMFGVIVIALFFGFNLSEPTTNSLGLTFNAIALAATIIVGLVVALLKS